MIRAIVQRLRWRAEHAAEPFVSGFADGSGIDLATRGQALSALHERNGIQPLQEQAPAEMRAILAADGPA